MTTALLSPSSASESDLKVYEDETLLEYDLNTIMEGLGVAGDDKDEINPAADGTSSTEKERRRSSPASWDETIEEENEDEDSENDDASSAQDGYSTNGSSSSSSSSSDPLTDEYDEDAPAITPSPNIYKNVARLHHLMKKQRWDNVTDILLLDPQAAKTWYYGTGDRGNKSRGDDYDGDDEDSSYLRTTTDEDDDDQTRERTMWKRLPLHNACRWGAPLSVVQLLLDQFVDATLCVDPYSGTLPVHLACRYNASYYLTEELLYDNGRIAAQQADNRGRLALHWACLSGNDSATIDLLLQLHPQGILHKDHPEHHDDDDAFHDDVETEHTPLDYAYMNPALASDKKFMKRMQALYDTMQRVQERTELSGDVAAIEEDETLGDMPPRSIIVATYDNTEEEDLRSDAGVEDEEEEEEDEEGTVDSSLDCLDGSRDDLDRNTDEDDLDIDERGTLTAAAMMDMMGDGESSSSSAAAVIVDVVPDNRDEKQPGRSMAVAGAAAVATATVAPRSIPDAGTGIEKPTPTNPQAGPTSTIPETAAQDAVKQSDDAAVPPASQGDILHGMEEESLDSFKWDDKEPTRTGAAAAVGVVAAAAAVPPSQGDITRGVEEDSIDSFKNFDGEDGNGTAVAVVASVATEMAPTKTTPKASEKPPPSPSSKKKVRQRQKAPRRVFYRGSGGCVTSRMTGVTEKEAAVYQSKKKSAALKRSMVREDSEEFDC